MIMAETDPTRITRTKTLDHHAEVMKLDGNWFRDWQRTTEYEFSNGRKFEHYWQTRGPFSYDTNQ